MHAAPRAFPVRDADTGVRLDVFLAEKLGLSRAQARRLLERGAVRVGDRLAGAVAKGERLGGGETVFVEPFTRPEDERAVAEPDLALAELAAGPGWLAVDKPAGMPVHPLRPDETGTALGAVAARHPEVHGVGEGGLRSGVVHRLDVETSGALLFATDEPTWQRLRAAFSEHRVEKVYRAIALGRLEEEGALEVGLVTARHRPARVRVVDERDAGARGVRAASMRFRPLELFAEATLVEVRPRTGFLHQIRAVLAHLGHPVAGDRTYGPGEGRDPTRAARHMLHASAVAFQEVRAESPDPPDFAALLESLRSGDATG